MSRFDRYLLSQYMVVFGFFSLLLVMVYWVNRAAILFDRLIGDGQSVGVFLEFTLLSLPSVVFFVLPMSSLVATLYTTNRLMNDSELVIARASGFGNFRMARPVLYYGLIVALFMSIVGHDLQPAASAILAGKRDAISHDVAAQFLEEGEFLHPRDGITFYIREISSNGELNDVFLSDRRGNSTSYYSAKRAVLIEGETGTRLLMFNGMVQVVSTDERLSVTRFDDLAYDITQLIESGSVVSPRAREVPTLALLRLDPVWMARSGANEADFLTTAHLRFTQPLFAVIASLLGFACLLTGGFSRMGHWRQIGMAAILILILKSFDNFVQGISFKSAASWPVLYLPTVAGVLVTALILGLTRHHLRKPRGAS